MNKSKAEVEEKRKKKRSKRRKRRRRKKRRRKKRRRKGRVMGEKNEWSRKEEAVLLHGTSGALKLLRHCRCCSTALPFRISVPHQSHANLTPVLFIKLFIYSFVFFFFLKSWVAWPGVCTETALKSGGGGGGIDKRGCRQVALKRHWNWENQAKIKPH